MLLNQQTVPISNFGYFITILILLDSSQINISAPSQMQSRTYGSINFFHHHLAAQVHITTKSYFNSIANLAFL